MSLSKSKFWYSDKCLQFSKRVVPLAVCQWSTSPTFLVPKERSFLQIIFDALCLTALGKNVPKYGALRKSCNLKHELKF
jgi:hypothetical protein